MGIDYTLYVDESGDAGIKVIKGSNSKGASPYMALGAVLIPNPKKELLHSRLSEIAKLFNKNFLHCSELNHRQKIRFIKMILPYRIKPFSVLSLKQTLGVYREDIDRNHEKYYNKCVQYLLEKVGQFMEQKNISEEQLDVIFEDCGFNSSQLKNFLQSCRKNPKHPSTKYLKNINPDKMAWNKKNEDKLLEIADLVAHSVYQCAHRDERNYYIAEPRYLIELSSKFYSCPKTNKIDGFGFKSVHNIAELKLDEDVESSILSLKTKS